MKILTILNLIVLFLSVNEVFATNDNEFQRLVERMETETDRQKIETCIEISRKNVSIDTALYYLNRAMNIAKEINFDSVYDIQIEISNCYYHKMEYLKAKSEAHKGIPMCKYTENPTISFEKIEMLIGVFSYAIDQNDTAIYYYDKVINSLKNDTTYSAQKLLSSTYINYGNIYLKKGENQIAFPMYFKSIEISQQIGNYEDELASIINLISIYLYIEDYENVKKYLKEAYRVGKKVTNGRVLGGSFITIGQVFYQMGDIDKAIVNCKKALNILEEGDYQRLIHIAYQNLYTYYLETNNLIKAQLYLRKADNGMDKYEDSYTKVAVLLSAAEFQRKKLHFSKAKQYLDSALLISKRYSYPIFYQKGVSEKILLMEAFGKQKEQIELYKELILLNDSIHKEDNKKIATGIRDKYEKEKTRRENEKLKTIATLEKEKNKLNRILLTLLISLLIGIVIIFIEYRKNSKRKQELQDSKLELQKSKLELQKKEIESKKYEAEKQHHQLIIKEQELQYKENLIKETAKLKDDKKALIKSLKILKAYSNSEGKNIIQKALLNIQGNFNQEEWDSFNISFKSKYSNFYKELLKIAPHLKQNDVELCALIKAEINTDEISLILGITKSAIGTRKNRLKKKLSISDNKNIEDFIRNIE